MGNDHENRQVDIKRNVIDSVVNLGDNNIIVIVNYYPQDSKARIIAGEAADLDCPYVGLYHFEPEDAGFFYGREVFVEKLFTAVQSRNFIPLVGASGSRANASKSRTHDL